MADNSPPVNSPDGDPASPRPSSTPGMIDFLAMGISTALCLVLGGGIGYGLDALAGTSPILTFVGLAFGLVAAVLITVKLVRRFL